jgi:lysozyme
MNLEFIKKHEGLRLKAYPDPATGGEPWTIGYGNTFYEDGSKVMKGDVITKERADVMFFMTVKSFRKRMRITATLTPNQETALTSLAYNIGVNAFNKSTLLRKVNNNPSDPTIKSEFMKWKNAGGRPMLEKRRASEATLYFTI